MLGNCVFSKYACTSCIAVVAITLAAPAFAGELSVVSVTPTARSGSASIFMPITIEFDQPINPATITSASFNAFGRWSGPVTGTYAFSNNDTRVTLVPDHALSSGEPVMVVLSNDIESATGDALRSAGYSYIYMTRTAVASLTLTQSQFFSTNRKGESSTPYGGFATDLNHDGCLDLTIINESTDDLRIFMSLADGEGTFADFTRPTTQVGNVPSPSEPADFNGDGHVDVAVCNTVGSSVSILLGNGDGTFNPHQQISIGGSARGIALIDVDGDGDTDILAAASSASRIALLLNDGSGVFAAPSFIEAGVSEEWALGAGDMNEDGLLDIVVGARSGQRIVVMLNNGDGTFSVSDSVFSGGRTWMINVADINGDGHDDVACVNSSQNNGGIIFGDGAGGLSSVTTYATDSFPLATDLGDLDGDGDLDWCTSSFSGDWRIFTNNGIGVFTFDQEVPSNIAASCALLVDVDNDQDLDFVGIDEIADELWIYKNDGTLHRAVVELFDVTVGSHLGGNVFSMRGSDDLYVHTRSGFGQTLVDLHNMEMIVGAITLVDAPNTLDLTIESRVDEPSGLAQIKLRNWNNNQFELIGSYSLGNSDQIDTINNINATNYVDGNGNIEVSIKHLVFVPFLAFTFESFIDQVQITVN